MKLVSRTCILAFLTLAALRTSGQEIWTIGPMVHINFGGEKRTTSFAIEAAWWKIKGVPRSIDFAVEFDKGKLRLYSETQTGIGLTGISLGPVLEFNFKESKTGVGIQGSCWINYILGADYRIRYVNKKRTDCIGFYGKIPLGTSGINGGGNGYHRHDWDDWD